MEEVIQQMGGIQVLAREMKDFQDTVSAFMEDEPKLIEQYNNQWVAYHDCRLRAHADSIDALLLQLREQQVPRGEALVRFISNERRIWLL